METKVVLTGDEGPLKRAVDSARATLNRFGDEAGQPSQSCVTPSATWEPDRRAWVPCG